MTPSETRINLAPQFFTERERPLVEHGVLSASTFLFDSGVCGLRLRNELGQLVMLPFQGQQIWSAEFGGAKWWWGHAGPRSARRSRCSCRWMALMR